MAELERLAVVGVMGASAHEHADLAEPLGSALARMGVHLLTGGGPGVMEAVSRGFACTRPRRGHVIGVLPGEAGSRGYRGWPGYPNRWVEVVIRTHLPDSGREGTSLLSRNHINVLSSHVIVALPGSWGTASEVALALRYDRAIVALVRERDNISNLPAAVPSVGTVEEAARFVAERLARV